MRQTGFLIIIIEFDFFIDKTKFNRLNYKDLIFFSSIKLVLVILTLETFSASNT